MITHWSRGHHEWKHTLLPTLIPIPPVLALQVPRYFLLVSSSTLFYQFDTCANGDASWSYCLLAGFLSRDNYGLNQASIWAFAMEMNCSILWHIWGTESNMSYFSLQAFQEPTLSSTSRVDPHPLQYHNITSAWFIYSQYPPITLNHTWRLMEDKDKREKKGGEGKKGTHLLQINPKWYVQWPTSLQQHAAERT